MKISGYTDLFTPSLDAHYTGPIVVGAMYDALQHLGFTGGRVLESSVGIGNFFGMMPSAMRNASQLHGVELDSLTSRLVAALYPEAKIAQATGFEDFQIPAEYFDAVIGNTPFGNQPLVDTERSPYSGFSIHNYFLAKSIDKLRPGGIMQVVVSHNFLDANDDRTRQWIGDRAALIGAVRLPNTAFKDNAGTEIVTDILIFQKRDGNGLPNDISAWRDVVDQINTHPKTGDTVTHKVNQFFTENPQLVLGSPSAGGNMYTANEYTVEATGDIKAQLAGWVTSLPQNIYDYIDRQADAAIEDLVIPEAIKVGSFYMNATGKVMQRSDDVMGNKTANEWVPPNEKAVARMQGMIALRDSLRTQMRIERLGQDTETGIEANRAKLNRLYDTFLKQHGHINNQTNRRLFLDDTEAQLLQALEFDYDKGISKAVAEKEGIDPREPSAVKADIFKRRVAFPPQDFMTVTTAKDALLASLNYRGRVDGNYMAEVYDKSVEDIIKELGDVVYDDPQTGIVTADDYLSGDVKTKLAVAIAAAQDNANYKRNVAALEKIIPLDKKPSEISVSIGAAFIPDDMYCQFIKHISGGDSTLTYIKTTGQWLINFSGQADPALNTGKFGTSDLSAQELLHLSMLGRGAVVKKTTRNADGSTTTVLLEKETEAAREKQNAIKDEWKKWLWSDAERADKIATIYNDKMNRIVARQFDGSHLTFPGMNPAINLLEHQKNGVWRGLQSYQVLYDHVVGAGKTFEMATLAMEMRRLGIARKPLFVVPNHLTLQWRSEFTRLYPGSNILAATPEDFSKDNRERLFSKIITGDWDAVVVGHSSLKRIGLPEATEKAVLQEQLDEIGDAIELMKRERGDRNIIRDMEGIRSRLEAKMKDKLASIGKRSKVVTFDELGIDALFVDEMHEFKNLSYNSTMDRNPGMGNPNGSAKAFDMFVKTRWLFDTFGDKTPFITATGTPVSNSLVEMYNMQRYMQYPLLKQEGLHVFDAWAKQFGSVENVYEVAPSGSGYRQSTRFAKFTNLPALMGLYNLFADTITLDDLKAQEESQGKRFPVPKLVGGKPVLVVAKRSPLVSSRMGVPTADTDADGNIKFLADLSNEVSISKNEESGKFVAKVGDHVLGHLDTEEDARLKIVEMALTPSVNVHPDSILGRFGRLRELTRATKGKVNALSLTGEANKVGLDYRLIEPDAPDFAGSKINLAVANMLNVYHQWGSDKGTQLVFCDMSIPLSARSSYSSKDRRVYIRDDAGAIDMKRGTLHTLDGHEDLPYFIVQRGEKDAKRFDVYDAASGVLVVKDSRTRQDAKEAANSLLIADDPRQDWIDKREIAREIEQAHIDEYNNEHDVETEGFEFYTREDIAGVSGSTKFSVYDDIKAKLMGKGIPEREIAFIHDYSTPTAKDKLFKAINAGEVRFTLGSTQKMGAGTNVQKLLVGLHHIDAPWRPSDLEQREGRIIRRGNALYARDPENFAVFIGRYATEQTYDTRRWQILEHKARGIEQLRKYDGTINEIDDIEGEAANAADMKAAASGDPLILEETKCRNNVRRLEGVKLSV
ncbi:MAG: DEAD/DEAH box helicase family protein [Methylococcaceae bacterium]|nr:DEAD/DEAH box helicase family protein [Methylococcaceae bacterium]MDP3903932.1 DEAD/DEAH box helicase family protein [Methylococcaceae bacterium]